MSSRVDSPANPSVLPENGGGREITVISGRRCSGLLTKSGPLGLSVRMLLESPLWWKEGFSLRWDASPLCSKRMTNFTDTNFNSPSPSNASAKTLRVLDTPSSRCLFRLRLLPTPTARDEKNPSSPDGKRIQRKMEQGYTIELNDLAAMQLLPTPTCNDSTNASIPPSQAKRNDSITKRVLTGEIPTDYTPNADGTPFRLSPLFTEEMMGFPFLWTTLPFLKQDGDLNPSRHTETVSCRK